MSAAGTSTDAPDRVAAAMREAGFVRLVATADGDALAATGLLARALAACEVPFQASVAAVPDVPVTDAQTDGTATDEPSDGRATDRTADPPAGERTADSPADGRSTGADCTVAVGHATGTVTLRETPLAVAAAEVASDLAPDAVDPELALAGAVAAGREPTGELLDAAGLERSPGVALSTTDVDEGVACSTLFHASFSGDADVAATRLQAVDVDDGRDLASLVALSAVEDAPPRAATAVERALYPYDCDRFETLGGFADVLDAVARERPGTGIALALGNDVAPAALSIWREHGRAAHGALRTADTGRYDGVYVARLGGGPEDDDPISVLGTVARLCLDYRSPEPVALAVVDGDAAVAVDADEDGGPSGTAVEDALRGAATALDGRSVARDGRGTATFDGGANDFVEAFREER